MTYKSLFLLFICVFLPTFSVRAEGPQESSAMENEITLPDGPVISRAFGHLIAKNLVDNPAYPFDLKSVIEGIQEEMEGKPSPLTEEQYEQAISQIQKKCFDEMSDQNLSQANSFLEENAHQEGVLEIVPGKLQMTVLKEGAGAAVSEKSTPLVHYTGRYLDQTVFGTSEEMEPIALELNEAIPGFKQGLIGAKEGESRRLYIHPDLGYGATGLLLPNALMVFDIEVLQADTDEPNSSSTTNSSGQS